MTTSCDVINQTTTKNLKTPRKSKHVSLQARPPTSLNKYQLKIQKKKQLRIISVIPSIEGWKPNTQSYIASPNSLVRDLSKEERRNGPVRHHLTHQPTNIFSFT